MATKKKDEDKKQDKPLLVLGGTIQTPPLSQKARGEVGFLLRLLQKGETLSLPYSRPMPDIGPRCHELRVQDENQTWRIIYLVDKDAIVVLEVFAKKDRKTPKYIIEVCKDRIKLWKR